MHRFIPPAWFLSAGVVILLVAGFGYADKTRLHWYAHESKPVATATVAAPEPDRIVGVIRVCSAGVGSQQVSATGDTCRGFPNDRLEMTVRTSQGTTYLVTMPVASSVTVGMAWPP